MRWFMLLAGTGAALMLAVPAARADWNEGDPFKMHFPQMPDLQTGMNIRACEPKVLADDWRCTQTGDVTDIHLWASWWQDIAFRPTFQISIWSDLPASQSAAGYSMPHQLLRERWFEPGQYTGRSCYRHDPDDPEPFFDPNENAVIVGGLRPERKEPNDA